MSFTFFNPLLLLGLAAAILPVLIHRITRRKAYIRKFSAVQLLLQSQMITARPQRLKHLLLLFLRILAVGGIVLMMARPLLVRPGIAALPDNGARVVIVDNSLSMGFREDRGQRLELAKQAAATILKDFGGQVALIETVRPQQGLKSRWLTSEAALEALREMPLSFGRGDAVSAFAQAYQLLEHLKIPKQILVFSDMARSDWEALNATRLSKVSDASIIFFRIGGIGRDPNFRIESVSLPDGDMVAGVPSTLKVRVSNLSDGEGSVHVRLYLDGKKADQKEIEVKPGSEGSTTFDVSIEVPGWIDGEIKISEDRLAADDSFYFPLKINDAVKVLLVDGDPTVSLKGSEAFFLKNALNPGGPEKTFFRVHSITESELQRVDLQHFDVFCLLNVSGLDFSRPAAILQAGKPLFMFLGNRSEPESYNKFALAPWQINGRIERRTQHEKGARIHQIAEALRFPATLAGSLKSARFYSYYRIDGSADVLLSLEDRNPLLLSAGSGNSRLYLFTSSADLDWNDLPLKAAYVPLMQGLFKKAAGLTGTSLPPGRSWGEPFDSDRLRTQTKGIKNGPGIYRFARTGGESRQGINTPREESDLVKLSTEALKKKFGPVDVQVLDYQEDIFSRLPGGRRELWPPLLIFLLAVLAIEMIVASGIRPTAGAVAG